MCQTSKSNSRVQLVITMIFTGIAFIISYLTNLFLAPYITNRIGTDAFGFIALARNFAGYATIITTALNSYAARYISIEYHRDNINGANKYFNSVLFANFILISIILTVSFLCIKKLDLLLNIPRQYVTDTKCLFVLVLLNFGITSVGTAFTAAAYIKNRLDLTGIFRGISYLVEACVIVAFYSLFGASLWVVGLGLVLAALEIFLANYGMTKKYTPELKIKLSLFSGRAVKTLLVNGIWNAINSLGNTLNTGLDLIITNLLLTPLAMGQLSYAKLIGTMFSALYQLISQPFHPVFLKLYANNDNENLIHELEFSMKVSGYFSSVAFAGFIALGEVYFRLWLPGQNIELIHMLTLLTIVSCLGEGAICPLYYVYTLATRFKIPCLVTIAGGVLNVCGMCILIEYTDLNVYAVVLTTAIISSVINIVFNPLYIAHCLKVSKITFMIPMARHLISCTVMSMLFALISRVYLPSSWFSLALTSIIYSIFGIGIHFLIVFDNRDRIIVYRIINRIRNLRQ